MTLFCRRVVNKTKLVTGFEIIAIPGCPILNFIWTPVVEGRKRNPWFTFETNAT